MKCSQSCGVTPPTLMCRPRPRNAFDQGSRLVRGHLRLLSELPADLSTKLFANANRVRLAAGKILLLSYR
jgi:hypothetical protein